MKQLLTLIAFAFALQAFGVTYPIKNYSYISDADSNREVEESDQYVVMVFSDSNCLNRSVRERDCFLFERKLDAYVPTFSSLVKVVGFNTYFENYQMVSDFLIHVKPTVILIKDNQVIKRLEATYRRPDYSQPTPGWQDELLRQTIEMVGSIR